jgi:2-(1,2-epoxy-1,2-dihydrophenyl)acetyl-CoA isomerase
MKENLNRAVQGELGECLDMEAAHHIHTAGTRDHHEASQAFVEKREPQFRPQTAAVRPGLVAPRTVITYVM